MSVWGFYGVKFVINDNILFVDVINSGFILFVEIIMLWLSKYVYFGVVSDVLVF